MNKDEENENGKTDGEENPSQQPPSSATIAKVTLKFGSHDNF